jgi:phosphoglycerate dehydrogenase-like enzyme
MISLSRRFPRMQANQRAHVWERWPQQILLGKTAVIAGIGPIAEDLATRCKAFGLTTIGISDARKEAVGFDQLLPRARITEACGRADFLVILVPLTDQTRGMINATVLSALKPTSIVINLARGPIIDEGALVEALQSGKIGGAGLDVFENEPLPSASPLWDMPNVIITPRIGGMSDEYPRQVLPVVVHNLSAFARGARDEMINVVR